MLRAPFVVRDSQTDADAQQNDQKITGAVGVSADRATAVPASQRIDKLDASAAAATNRSVLKREAK